MLEPLEPLPAFLKRFHSTTAALWELEKRGAPVPRFTLARWMKGQNRPDLGWVSALALVGIDASPEALQRNATPSRAARPKSSAGGSE